MWHKLKLFRFRIDLNSFTYHLLSVVLRYEPEVLKHDPLVTIKDTNYT